MFTLKSEFARAEIGEDGSLRLIDKEAVFFLPPPARLASVRSLGDGRVRMELMTAPPARADVFFDGSALVFRLEAEGDMPEGVAFPPPVESEPGDVYVYPIGEGYRADAADAAFPVPESLAFYNGMEASLWAFALERGETCLLTGVERGCDARLVTRRNNRGLRESGVQWISQKGAFGYAREARLFLARDLPGACGLYRAWRERLGTVRTLAEKEAHTPALSRLFGAADVWLWDDNNTNRLYGRPEVPGRPARDVRRVAREMKKLGMTRVLWNGFEGETREDCAFLKAQGYLVGKYDVYRDVIPHSLAPKMLPYRLKRCRHMDFWPRDVRVEKDGSLAKAWPLHSVDGGMYDQNAVCDLPALRMTMTDVPMDVEAVGYDARFVDVQAAGAFSECCHPLHPATRTDSARYIAAQSEFLGDMGLVSGVEVGSEALVRAYHYSEGLMSLPLAFRPEDAGRRMDTLYYGRDVPRQTDEGMLNPRLRVPFWDLVYHDCCVNYWYWGDSTNCCPERMRVRDLFDALCGQPPIYSLNVSQWDALKGEIAASYARATPVAALTAKARMTDWRWLSDDGLVQAARYENGVSVTVNFSSERRTLPDGRVLAPLDYAVQED